MRPIPTECLWEEWIISFSGIIIKFKVCQYGIVNGNTGTEIVVNLINSWLCCPYSVISV